ncbi:MAG: FecR domain-containing protein [Candidatus Omnitrophica bacterium]|nr:FecR domain-containing protein [Candidatus Omnitrophota bacterium]
MKKWNAENQLLFSFVTRYTSNISHVLVAGGALIAVLFAVNFLTNDSPDRARIVRIQGNVAIERADMTIFPGVGALLNPQDRVRTGEGAFVEIAYDDALKDVMRIGANSRVVFESARIEKMTMLFMDKGEIKVKLDSLEKGSTFKVRTPVAIAGVRGTAFGVHLDHTQAQITDYESRIFVKGLTEDHLEMRDELLLNSGWKVQVAQFERPANVQMLSVGELSEWKAWLAEIDSLSKAQAVTSASSGGLASIQETLLQKPLDFLTTVRMKVSASPAILSMMLYAVLALGTGKVVERVWLS